MHVAEIAPYFRDLISRRTHPPRDLLGLEFENFAVVPSASTAPHRELPPGTPLPWAPLPMGEEQGVQHVLETVRHQGPREEAWTRIEELQEDGSRLLLGVQQPQGWNITVEPGGQLELSDAPREELAQVAQVLNEHLVRMQAGLDSVSGRMICLGAHPFFTPDQLPFLAKHRYRVMYDHMPRIGTLGRWMMKASSGVQVNLDYHSVEDLERKMVLLNRAAPFLAALFANSPLLQGAPSGYLSFRTHIWSDTDRTRSGLPAPFLDPKFKAEDYVNWALDASPYLLAREGKLVWTADHAFRNLLEGSHPDIVPTWQDWEAHLGMLFPDIRLKNILEVRVFDSLPPQWAIAIPALLKGLVYEESGIAAAESLLLDLPADAYPLLREVAARDALQGTVGSLSLEAIGKRLVEIALEALGSADEEWLLPYFEQFTKDGRVPAEGVLERFAASATPADWLEAEWRATGLPEGQWAETPGLAA